jgi:hypothetical protein
MKRVFALLIAAQLTACTWVKVIEQAEAVKVMTADDVTSCKRVGKTTVMTAAKILGMDRHAYKVRDELDTLARNSAVGLEGDTVVPLGEHVEGRQVYEVYRCNLK